MHPVFYWLAAASVITFAAFAIDKARARGQRRRIRERTLHLMSAAGGWPGAVLAIALLRHKNKKPSFWMLVVFFGLVWAWVLGRIFVR